MTEITVDNASSAVKYICTRICTLLAVPDPLSPFPDRSGRERRSLHAPTGLRMRQSGDPINRRMYATLLSVSRLYTPEDVVDLVVEVV